MPFLGCRMGPTALPILPARLVWPITLTGSRAEDFAAVLTVVIWNFEPARRNFEGERRNSHSIGQPTGRRSNADIARPVLGIDLPSCVFCIENEVRGFGSTVVVVVGA